MNKVPDFSGYTSELMLTKAAHAALIQLHRVQHQVPPEVALRICSINTGCGGLFTTDKFYRKDRSGVPESRCKACSNKRRTAMKRRAAIVKQIIKEAAPCATLTI